MSCPYEHIKRKPIQVSNDQDLTFQIVSWFDKDTGSLDAITLEDAMDLEYGSAGIPDPQEYKMYMFGVTSQGHSVSVKINGYQPFFFVKIPQRWTSNEIERFISYTKERRYYSTDESGVKMQYKYKYSIAQIKVVDKEDVDAGFTNGELFKFLGMQFKNFQTMRKCSWMLWKERYNKSSPAFGVKLYESNIPPVLRFMHIQKILSVGWVILPADSFKVNQFQSKETFCQIETEIKWTDIQPNLTNNSIAPIRQCSFDIECFSVTGQMPIPEISGNKCIQIASAIKDYTGECILKHILTLKKSHQIEGCVVECCETERELLIKWAMFMQSVDPFSVIFN